MTDTINTVADVLVEDARAVGLVSSVYSSEDKVLTFRLIPVELILDNRIIGEYLDLECYPDKFVLNGKLATDEEVIVFLKKLATGWAARLSERT